MPCLKWKRKMPVITRFLARQLSALRNTSRISGTRDERKKWLEANVDLVSALRRTLNTRYDNTVFV